MKNLIYHSPWDLRLCDSRNLKLTRPDDVIVQIKAVGICGTDLSIVTGQYPPVRPPVVLGHEAAGVVHSVGSEVTDLRIGDRVAINPTYSCGYCRMCVTQRSNHCLHKDGTECGVSADGMFRQYHRTQRRFLHPFPAGLPFHAAALTEPLSCALTGVQQLNLRIDHAAVVVGAGPMGILYSHVLAVHGVLGMVVESSDARRSLAAKALPPGWQCASSLDEALEAGHSTRLDVGVDTSGKAVEDLVGALARGGQVLAVGLGRQQITMEPAIFADHSKRLIGSIDSLDGSFAAALSLIATDRLPIDAIVSHVLPLWSYSEAFRLLGVDMEHRRRLPPEAALKVVLTP